MNWEKVKSWSIGVAVVMILVTLAPPVLTDPLVTALSQMRHSYANTDTGSEGVLSSISDATTKILKNIAK